MYLGPLQPTAWPFVKMTGLIYRHSVILLIFKKTHVHMVSYCCSLSCILEMQAHFTVFLWQMCIPLCNMDLVSEKDRTLFFPFFFLMFVFWVLFCFVLLWGWSNPGRGFPAWVRPLHLWRHSRSDRTSSSSFCSRSGPLGLD